MQWPARVFQGEITIRYLQAPFFSSLARNVKYLLYFTCSEVFSFSEYKEAHFEAVHLS